MGAAVALADGPSTARGRRRMTLVVAAAASVAAVAISVAIALSDGTGDQGLVALARALVVGAPLAVGLHTWYTRPGERFGLVLIAAGAAWWVSTLAESSDAWLYTVGRLAGWVIEVLLVYLFLSFPTGRLPGRRDRLLVLAMAAVVLVMYLPRLLLAADFEVPSPYTSCLDGCPANAFFALDSEPAIVDGFLRPVGVLLVLAVMIAVVARLRNRLLGATPLNRRMLMPVLVVAIARAALLGVAIVARQVESTAWPLEIAAWLLALAVPAIAFAFFLGLLRWRLYAERALQSLAACLRDLPDPVMLRQAFADAFKDPSIEIAFPAGGGDGWVDSRGEPVSLPPAGSGRKVTDVRNHGELVAAVVHDEGLESRPELVEAGAAMAAVVLDNQRLAAQAEASIRELSRSRARIASSAASERRRIERDLHDGAQQRLVALRIELELAEDVVRQDPERGAARLRELERELDDALEDLRSLAHGVYPPLLADRGLTDALRSVAARSTIPVDLEVRRLGRYEPEVESAIYFCVLEALQNALKHATGARRVVVRVGAGPLGELRFSVRDDGAGTDALRAGAGITNMQDRLAAVGGEVTVSSTPGVGTDVRGRVPVSRA